MSNYHGNTEPPPYSLKPYWVTGSPGVVPSLIQPGQTSNAAQEPAPARARYNTNSRGDRQIVYGSDPALRHSYQAEVYRPQSSEETSASISRSDNGVVRIVRPFVTPDPNWMQPQEPQQQQAAASVKVTVNVYYYQQPVQNALPLQYINGWAG